MSKPPKPNQNKPKKSKEPELEHSEFSGEFEDEGITVLVDIFRNAGTNEDWTLEVISQTEVITTWEDGFATDKDAWEEFLATAEKDGLESFLEEGEGEPSVH
jgi:hypothetical protein